MWYQFSGRGAEEPEPTERVGYIPQIINAKHQYKNGVHVVAGEVDLPTSCYLLESDAFVEVREPDTDRAMIQFTTTGDDEICAQVITVARFKETFNAQKEAEIVATWNGGEVRLNLVDVGQDENLDDFELFIKG